MLDFQSFADNIQSVGWVFIAVHAAHYIIFIHLVGGALITLGAFTRLSAAVNLPILIGAVDLNLIAGNQGEFIASLLVLILLAVTFIYGGGKYSLDEIRRKQDQRKSLNHAI